MTKKLIPGLAAVILLAGTVLFIINKNSAANSVHDFETAFKDLISGEIQNKSYIGRIDFN